MLESALKFQKAFERLEEEDGNYVSYFLEDESGKRKMGPPRFDDWETSRVFVKFLKKFYDATLKFSASLSVTSNLYFHEVFSIQSELTELSTNTDPFLGTMATSMKRKYDKYWGSIESINKLLLISIVLDPRYKLDYVIFCLGHLYGNDKGEEMTKGLKELLCRLYECYNGRNSNSIGTQSSNDFQLLNGMNVDKDKHDGDFRFVMLQKFKKMRETKDCIDTKNEVDRYMLEPSEDPYNENFDILLWWKLNATKYQVLSQIARDVFAIPVSTVASESAFSTGGRILDSFRSSLGAKTVEALICTQNWLRSTSRSIKFESIVEEMKFLEVVESDNIFVIFFLYI